MNWRKLEGPEQDVVINTEATIVRNLAGKPFPHRMTPATAQQAIDTITETARAIAPDMMVIDLADLSAAERAPFLEAGQIGPRAHREDQPAKLLTRESEDLNLSVLAEDTLQIRAFAAGLQPRFAAKRANDLAKALEQRLDFATDSQFGYLTASPANVGTGLRLAITLHLPGLEVFNQIGKMREALAGIGYRVTGLNGDNDSPAGSLYRVTNRVTLGISMRQIADRIQAVAEKVIEQERQSRRLLAEKRETEMRDRAGRALGKLRYAHLTDYREAMETISDIRVGKSLGYITGLAAKDLLIMQYAIGPAAIQKRLGHEATEQDINLERAKYMRETAERALSV